ncbi:hypothetical protein RSAG8_09628, partial [Rhizoctonia solani AG-8 WAC10335]
MSNEQEVDALFQAKLEEHYEAANQPDEIDEAFAHRYFEELVAASAEPTIFAPHTTTADLEKKSQDLVDVKITSKNLKFVASKLDANWPFPGTSQTFGSIEVGAPYKWDLTVYKKILTIQIKRKGSAWKRVVYVGPCLSNIKNQRGEGTWEKI